MAYYSFIETTFWLSSPALQVFLLMWAVRKRLFSAFPAFFWYLAFALAKTAVQYPMRRVASVSYYYYSQSIGMQPEWTLIESGAYACAMMTWVFFFAREPKKIPASMVPENDLAAWNHALVEMLTR